MSERLLQNDRRLHYWDVVLQSSDGEIHEQRLAYPWNPDKDFVTPESIARAAAAEAHMQDKSREWVGVSARLV